MNLKAKIQAWWKRLWAKIREQPRPETARKPQNIPFVEPAPTPLPVEPAPTLEPAPEPVEPAPEPIPEPLPPPIGDLEQQIARSWENGAAWREHNELCDGVPFMRFAKHVDEKKADGCNAINLYLMNMRDGAPVPTTFYANGGFGGAVDNQRVARMREKIEYAYAVGMQVNFWMLPDDGGYNAKDAEKVQQYFVDCKTHFGAAMERATYIVVCLEANEVLGSYNRLNEYAKSLKYLFGNKIANHMTSGKVDWSIKCKFIAVHFHQVNPRKSVSDCEKELKNIVAVCTKPVIACEIDLSGKSATAREKAKRAMAAGCIGVHSGVPKE